MTARSSNYLWGWEFKGKGLGLPKFRCSEEASQGSGMEDPSERALPDRHGVTPTPPGPGGGVGTQTLSGALAGQHCDP